MLVGVNPSYPLPDRTSGYMVGMLRWDPSLQLIYTSTDCVLDAQLEDWVS